MSVLDGKLIELLFNQLLAKKGISVTMSSKIIEEVHCKRCGESMGEFDEDELICLMLEGIDTVLCFDCDPESAATTPSIFWQWQDTDFFAIGDQGFEIVRGKMVMAGNVLTHARARMRTRGLSSYTYLNRPQKNRVFLGNGNEVEICQRCHGDGIYGDEFSHVSCFLCEGKGFEEIAIFLPRWILGLGCENV